MAADSSDEKTVGYQLYLGMALLTASYLYSQTPAKLPSAGNKLSPAEKREQAIAAANSTLMPTRAKIWICLVLGAPWVTTITFAGFWVPPRSSSEVQEHFQDANPQLWIPVLYTYILWLLLRAAVKFEFRWAILTNSYIWSHPVIWVPLIGFAALWEQAFERLYVLITIFMDESTPYGIRMKARHGGPGGIALLILSVFYAAFAYAALRLYALKTTSTLGLTALRVLFSNFESPKYSPKYIVRACSEATVRAYAFATLPRDSSTGLEEQSCSSLYSCQGSSR